MPVKNKKQELLLKLSKYNLVLVGVHKSNVHAWKRYDFNKNVDLFIQNIALQSKIIVSVFANPYSLNSFLFVNNFDAVVLSYQNSETSQEMTDFSYFWRNIC